jgi:hypothetical protein
MEGGQEIWRSNSPIERRYPPYPRLAALARCKNRRYEYKCSNHGGFSHTRCCDTVARPSEHHVHTRRGTSTTGDRSMESRQPITCGQGSVAAMVPGAREYRRRGPWPCGAYGGDGCRLRSRSVRSPRRYAYLSTSHARWVASSIPSSSVATDQSALAGRTRVSTSDEGGISTARMAFTLRRIVGFLRTA